MGYFLRNMLVYEETGRYYIQIFQMSFFYSNLFMMLKVLLQYLVCSGDLSGGATEASPINFTL